MERDECWMSFSEALEQYLAAREVIISGKYPMTSIRYAESQESVKSAAEHMDALTDSTHLR